LIQESQPFKIGALWSYMANLPLETKSEAWKMHI